MQKTLRAFEPRQEMLLPDFELMHKWDTDLKEVELHHHDFYEVNLLMSGDVTYVIEGRVYHVLPGDMLIINPKELHQVYIQPDAAPYERYMLWITPSLLQQLSSSQTDLCHCFDTARPNYGNLLHLSAEQKNAVQGLMEAICADLAQPGFGSDLLCHNLLTSLMVLTNRLAELSDVNSSEKPASGTVVSQVIDHINLHYEQPLSLDTLAERFFVSKYHLSHEFSRQTGTSIYQYLLKKRLLIARQLMAQGRKPQEVYASCGFGDYAAFFRAFRKVYGQSPRDFIKSIL